MRCAACGHENPEGAGWCGRCRRPLQPVQGPIVEPPSQRYQPPTVPPPSYQYFAPPPSPPPPRPKLSRTAILVAAISGLVLLVGAVFVARELLGSFRPLGSLRFQKAIQLEAAGRREEALALYQKMVLDRPDDAPARLAYAEALRRAERHEDAVEQYEEALRIEPELKDAWVALGITAYESGDLEKSAKAYHEAIDLDDSLAIAHNNLAYVLYDQDEIDEAVSEWEKAVENLSRDDANKQGRADCWAGLAIGYLGQGKREKAVRVFRRATAIDRGYLSTRYMKDEAFWSDKALAAAEELIPEVRVEPSPLPHGGLPSA